MPQRDHRKRALLFLAAILLPSAVLVGTTVRLIRQQRELTLRRAQEERALLALRIGQELLEDLRRLSDRVSEGSLNPPEIHTLTDSEPALLTLAVAKDDRWVFPWETHRDPSSALDPADFSRYVRLLERGEEAEYQREDFHEAEGLYGQAADLFLAESRREESLPDGRGPYFHATSVLRGEAKTHQARALHRGGQTADAQAVFRELAEMPPNLTDTEGIPFRIYGLDGLHRIGTNPEDLVHLLRQSLLTPSHSSPSAALALRDVAWEIAGTLDADSTGDVVRGIEEGVARRLAVLERLEALRRDLPGVVATAQRGVGERGRPQEPLWVSYGEEPWLVGISGATDDAPARAAVVKPVFLLRPGEDPGGIVGEGQGLGNGDELLLEATRILVLLPARADSGESLGRALIGLRGSFPPGFPPSPYGGGVEGWFFRLLLPIILILTGFTAYLAWRDVKRESEAVRLRSQFVSSVTHELKTPLTSIRMFAETLRLGRHSGPEAQREYLDTVVHETERLSRLINNVLDFARIDRGEMTYHMAPTDAGAAAREAARAVAYPLAQGGYTLTTDIAADLPMVEADSDALTQALLNLLSNAIKFSREGTEILFRVFPKEGDVLFQVEDRGKGIAGKDREAIFRDFFRTADAEEEGIPGTGLGLSLVAHVAEAHGGQVEVDSEVGRGSTFTIRIPIERRPFGSADALTNAYPHLDPNSEEGDAL